MVKYLIYLGLVDINEIKLWRISIASKKIRLIENRTLLNDRRTFLYC